MSILINPNMEFTENMLKMLRANDGYCPNSLVKVPDMKCMCQEFREMEEGTCHCGLYTKRKDLEEDTYT